MERKSAVDFIVHDNSYEDLSSYERLADILENLKRSFGGGFVDLSILDTSGLQKNYVGPYSFQGRDYSNQEWFKQVMDSGVYQKTLFEFLVKFKCGKITKKKLC